MSYRFSNMSWISRSKLTLNNFTSKPAASINPTTTNDDDPVVTLHHQSCMEIPPVAGNGIDIKSKDIRYIFIYKDKMNGLNTQHRGRIYTTSMLRVQSIHLVHCAKRCR